jgi:hypothetical protein
MRLPPCFRPSNDIIKYTIEKLLDITVQYATSEAVAGAVLAPCDGEEVPISSRETPRGGLSKPCVLHQVETQGVRHDKIFYDLGCSH